MRDRRPTHGHEAPPARREPLPPLPAEGPALARILAARRSVREYAPRALTPLEVGWLLWAGQGITSPDGGRTAPSAGALHPTTLSLADARGVFRYAPRAHALTLVREGDARARLAAAALGQEMLAEAPVTLAVSADPAVLAPRYGNRSARYCTLEAGHVAQNILLQAVSLGLCAVPVAAFDDDAVRAVLDLPGGHLALYLVPVGAPRAGGG